MFFTLLLATFVIAAVVSAGVIKLFDKPVGKILRRIIKDDISSAWHRYITFAGFVVGISGGVRIYDLERYISAPHKGTELLVLNAERWTLEIYRTVIETLQSIAWMYLLVFVFALVAYVIVKGFELKRGASDK
ncbi:hypothetical protein SAMN05661010_00380 [Modicisalibacter muralis]|uniref:Uncharacterized protein n=1 Tax=Modicisalibacter muralis TaxID=119000 RepID=A0A1G9FGE7_9GAMM|nr:hypothetical protein [Halomonas muralis]SDK87474.1 hypothetical protein SAMN05661010_00380 [Halomonas muralis]